MTKFVFPGTTIILDNLAGEKLKVEIHIQIQMYYIYSFNCPSKLSSFIMRTLTENFNSTLPRECTSVTPRDTQV